MESAAAALPLGLQLVEGWTGASAAPTSLLVVSLVPEGASCIELCSELFSASPQPWSLVLGKGSRMQPGSWAVHWRKFSTPKPLRQGAEKQTWAWASHWDNSCLWKEILAAVRSWA